MREGEHCCYTRNAMHNIYELSQLWVWVMLNVDSTRVYNMRVFVSIYLARARLVRALLCLHFCVRNMRVLCVYKYIQNGFFFRVLFTPLMFKTWMVLLLLSVSRKVFFLFCWFFPFYFFFPNSYALAYTNAHTYFICFLCVHLNCLCFHHFTASQMVFCFMCACVCVCHTQWRGSRAHIYLPSICFYQVTAAKTIINDVVCIIHI